jgi:hypothetical protein
VSPTPTDFFEPPAPCPGCVQRFAPEADASTDSARRYYNQGLTTILSVVGTSGTQQRSLLRFRVSGVDRPVESATMTLFPLEDSDSGGSLYRVTNGWSETGVTWSNQPALPPQPLAASGPVSRGSPVGFDVTALVAGDGTYSFALSSLSSDRARYGSRESTEPAYRPVLVVVLR